MKRATKLSSLARVRSPVVLAAGFFDGVHRGHQKVIGEAIRRARESGGEAWVLTFDRHPMRVVQPGSAPQLLTSNRHKLALLDRVGVDGCLMLPFTRRTAGMAPDAFVRMLLGSAPSICEILVGRGWRFGRGGKGNVALLRRSAREREILVTAVRPVSRKGKPVSSTRVREEIRAGRLGEAAAMLGRPFSIAGTVGRGRTVGRQLGYPTANLEPDNEVLPPHGVYAVHAALRGRTLAGVLNLGVRPTFGNADTAEETVELHLLDFRGNLYGATIETFFLHRLRHERRFRDLSALRDQIESDIAGTRGILAGKNLKESLYTPIPHVYSPART